MVPWREEAAPQPAWIRIPLPDGTGWVPPRRISTTGNVFYLFEGSKLMAVRFDPKTGGFSEPYEVKFVPGSAVTLKPDDDWTVRGPGLVFSRWEGGSSVWLMSPIEPGRYHRSGPITALGKRRIRVPGRIVGRVSWPSNEAMEGSVFWVRTYRRLLGS